MSGSFVKIRVQIYDRWSWLWNYKKKENMIRWKKMNKLHEFLIISSIRPRAPLRSMWSVFILIIVMIGIKIWKWISLCCASPAFYKNLWSNPSSFFAQENIKHTPTKFSTIILYIMKIEYSPIVDIRYVRSNAAWYIARYNIQRCVFLPIRYDSQNPKALICDC